MTSSGSPTRSMRKYLRNVGVSLDQLFNALTGGDPDEYLSSRLGKAQRGDFGTTAKVLTWPFRFIVDVLFYPVDGWGHCAQSIEEDEGKDELVLSGP